MAAGLIGGLTPLLAIWAKSPWPIALYLVGIGAISMIAVMVSPPLGHDTSAAETPMDAAVLPGLASRN